MKTYVFNTVLVHCARTWERIRVKQPYQEMRLDNIESVDAIVKTAEHIMEDAVIKDFLATKDREHTWDWDRETGMGCSDTYIEHLAEKFILQEYLEVTK